MLTAVLVLSLASLASCYALLVSLRGRNLPFFTPRTSAVCALMLSSISLGLNFAAFPPEPDLRLFVVMLHAVGVGTLLVIVSIHRYGSTMLKRQVKPLAYGAFTVLLAHLLFAALTYS
jgi:hypothetical protein